MSLELQADSLPSEPPEKPDLFHLSVLSSNSNLILDANAYGSSLLWRRFPSICLTMVIPVEFRVWVLKFHQLLRK